MESDSGNQLKKKLLVSSLQKFFLSRIKKSEMAVGDTGFFLLLGFSAFLIFIGLCLEGFHKLRAVFYTIVTMGRTHSDYGK